MVRSNARSMEWSLRVLTFVCLVSGCSEFSSELTYEDPGAALDGGVDGASLTDSGGSFEPEPEPQDVPAPAVSSRFVYVAAPSAGVVARIDAATLGVTPVRVGRRPESVAASVQADVAVVLNAGSDTISVIRGLERAPTATLPIIQGCNQLRISEDGQWAAAWFQADGPDAGNRGNLQEISLLRLNDGESFVGSVGFNVSDVRFSPDGSRLVAVTEDGVSTIELQTVADDFLAPITAYASAPGELVGEVVLSASGRWAAVASPDGASVQLIDTADGRSRVIPMGAAPTDVDLDEQGGRMLVALRDSGELAVYELGMADVPPQLIKVDGVPPGLVTLIPPGEQAVVYSPSSGVAAMALVDLTTAEVVRVYRFQKSVVDVQPSLDGALAIAIHPAESDAGTLPGVDQRTARSPGYSVVDMASGYTKLVLTASQVRETVRSAAGTSVYLLFDGARGSEVHWIDVASFARRDLLFDTAVDTMGWVTSGSRLFVLGTSGEGQLWFINESDGRRQNVSSFILNAYTE